MLNDTHITVGNKRSDGAKLLLICSLALVVVSEAIGAPEATVDTSGVPTTTDTQDDVTSTLPAVCGETIHQWSGLYRLAGADSVEVTYQTKADGTMTMQLYIEPLSEYRYRIAKVVLNDFHVAFYKDDDTHCELKRISIDHDYEGKCTNGNGDVVVPFISMREKSGDRSRCEK